MKTLLRRGAIAAATAAVLAGLGATPAHAQGGGPNYYDGKDPAATGCNRNASLIATRPVRDRANGAEVATLQVFYSWSCGTNWIRVTGNPYGGYTVKWIQSHAGGYDTEWDWGDIASYGMMVYAPGDTKISASAHLLDANYTERAVAQIDL